MLFIIRGIAQPAQMARRRVLATGARLQAVSPAKLSLCTGIPDHATSNSLNFSLQITHHSGQVRSASSATL